MTLPDGRFDLLAIVVSVHIMPPSHRFGLALGALSVSLFSCSQNWDPVDAGSDTTAAEEAGPPSMQDGDAIDGAVDATDTMDGGVDAALDADRSVDDGALDTGLPDVVVDPEPITCGGGACLHGGTCSVSGGKASCLCPSAWTGASCELDVNECAGTHGCPANTPCQNLAGGYTCEGEFADFPLPRANARRTAAEFEVAADTVLDKLTGLRWHSNINRTLNGTQSNRGTHAQALAYCQNDTTGGFSDWRLPSYVEQLALHHGSTANDVLSFPATNNHVVAALDNSWNLDLWTLSLDRNQSPIFYWYWTGETSTRNETQTTAAVRCVRRDQVKCALPSATRFSKQGGSLIDVCTKLVWSVAPSPSRGDYTAADSYCKALKTDGRSWRVPSLLELMALLDHTSKFVSAVDAPSGCYVTSTREVLHSAPDAGTAGDYFVVKHDGEPDFEKFTGSSCYARCVSSTP